MRLRWAVLAAVLAWGIVPAPVAGQEPGPATELRSRGCCLDDVDEGARVESVKIVGNKAIAASTIKNAIFTTGSGSFPWSQQQELNKREFLDDLRRLYVLYQRAGYFDFELQSYQVEQRGDGVRVVFNVSEGLPTRVEQLEISGFEDIDGESLETELRRRIPLKEGQVFTESYLLASRELLEAEFKNRGYAFAQVLLEYRIRKTERTASITYSVDPGEPYFVGVIEVSGADDEDDAALVLEQLVFETGDQYRARQVLASQRRVYELGLFRLVDIEPQLMSVRADTLDFLVSVVPAPTRVVRVGVGYGTEDLIRVQGSWLDRNFFGRSRQLEIRGLYSRLEREAAATYRQPTFVSPDLSLTLSTFLRFETEDNYTVERLGSTARVVYRWSRNLNASGAVTAERADFSEFDRGVLIPELGRDFINPSRLLTADLGVTFDNTDSLFSPTRGYRAQLAYQIGIPVSSFDYAYSRITFQIRSYAQLRDGWVVAGKFVPGAIFTYSGDPDEDGEGRTPLFQRLFAGGSTSVRGYERRQLGPKDDPASFGQTRDPEPIGGSGLVETGVELRFPIVGRLRGTAFVDAGNVWEDPADIALTDLEYTPGAGLRYVTPIGPLRLDVARRMSSDEPFLPRWVFHLSIGDAY